LTSQAVLKRRKWTIPTDCSQFLMLSFATQRLSAKYALADSTMPAIHLGTRPRIHHLACKSHTRIGGWALWQAHPSSDSDKSQRSAYTMGALE